MKLESKYRILFFTAEVHMGDILPSGNVAVGLVFNYFVGYLRQVLPGKGET